MIVKTEYIRYKGKGEHSVNELEKIIEQREEELHLIKSGDVVKNNGALGSVSGSLTHRNVGSLIDRVTNNCFPATSKAGRDFIVVEHTDLLSCINDWAENILEFGNDR